MVMIEVILITISTPLDLNSTCIILKKESHENSKAYQLSVALTI
jgi:hypothetical protein